jgi:hypothetical protein
MLKFTLFNTVKEKVNLSLRYNDKLKNEKVKNNFQPM